MNVWIIFEGGFYSSRVLGVFSSYHLACTVFDQVILTKKNELLDDPDNSRTEEEVLGRFYHDENGDYTHEFLNDGVLDVYFKIKEFKTDKIQEN